LWRKGVRVKRGSRTRKLKDHGADAEEETLKKKRSRRRKEKVQQMS